MKVINMLWIATFTFLIASFLEAKTLTPVSNGGGHIPNYQGNIDFVSSNGNYVKDIYLPGTNNAHNGDTIVLKHNAWYSSKIHLKNTDLSKIGILKIKRNQQYKWKFNSATTKWELQVSNSKYVSWLEDYIWMSAPTSSIEQWNSADGIAWKPELYLPYAANKGDILIFNHMATYETILHNNHINTSATLRLKKGDRYIFQATDGEPLWVLKDYPVRSYNAKDLSSSSIPDMTSPKTKIYLSNGNHKGTLILPSVANSGDLIVIKSDAEWATKIENITRSTTIQKGQTFEFVYNGDTSEWNIHKAPHSSFVAANLNNGYIPNTNTPTTSLSLGNGNHRKDVYLPAAGSEGDKFTISTEAEWDTEIHGDQTMIMHKGEKYVFIVENNKWILKEFPTRNYGAKDLKNGTIPAMTSPKTVVYFSNGNHIVNIYLPTVGKEGDTIIVKSDATYKTTIVNAKYSAIVSKGESFTFVSKSGEWVNTQYPPKNYNVYHLNNGKMFNISTPVTSLYSSNANYRKVITLPHKAKNGDKIWIYSDAALTFSVYSAYGQKLAKLATRQGYNFYYSTALEDWTTDATAIYPKPKLKGFVLRGDVPSGAPGQRNHFDNPFDSGATWGDKVDGLVITAEWSALQPTEGGEIASNNIIDQALATIREWNAGKNREDWLFLKLRVFAGIYSPDWVKERSGFMYVDYKNAKKGTLPYFWRQSFQDDWRAFQQKLGAKYDNQPLILDVALSGCMTHNAETMWRNYGAQNNTSIEDLKDNGLTVSADEACLLGQIDVAADSWKKTNISMAMNGWKDYDAPKDGNHYPQKSSFIQDMMNHCYYKLGERCIVGNNSVGEKAIDKEEHTDSDNALYYVRNYGASKYIQTITVADDIHKAINYSANELGASMAELPKLKSLDKVSTGYLGGSNMQNARSLLKTK